MLALSQGHHGDWQAEPRRNRHRWRHRSPANHPQAAPSAVKHCFRRRMGTVNGCQFGIAPVAVDKEDFGLRHCHEVCKGAIEIRCHPDIFHRGKTESLHTGSQKNTLSDRGGIATLAKRHDKATTVSPLIDRQRRCFMPTAILLVLDLCLLERRQFAGAGRNAARIPAGSGVYLGVVHASGQNKDKHLAYIWFWHRNIPVFCF